jgi:LemA protein
VQTGLQNGLIAAGAVVLFVLLSLAISYNRFVQQRNLIRDSWANIDTELRRRYDLIPNLVETVKGYASHERGLLEHLAAVRSVAVNSTGPPAEQARVERDLVGTLRQLFVVVEGYPQLKASANFLALQQELAVTEDRIQAARRFYNNNVRDYNRRVQSFPSNVVAGLFTFPSADYFEVEEAVRAAGAPSAEISG